MSDRSYATIHRRSYVSGDESANFVIAFGGDKIYASKDLTCAQVHQLLRDIHEVLEIEGMVEMHPFDIGQPLECHFGLCLNSDHCTRERKCDIPF